MPIHLACHGCGKSFSVPDHFAGRRGKCKHCGTAMDVPEFAPASPATFVVEDEPIRLRTPRRVRLRFGQAVGAILILAFLTPIAWFLYAVPKMDNRTVAIASMLFLTAGFLAIVIGLPILIPVSLARKGMLTVARWLILAATAFVIAVVSGAFFWFLAANGFLTDNDPSIGGGDVAGIVSVLVLVVSVFLMIGCLVAAVAHEERKR